MKKTLLAIGLVLAFLFAFSLSQAAITTVPWRYDTTTDKLWQYPSTTAQVGIGTTTPFQPLTVVGNSWTTGPYVHVGNAVANSPITAAAAGLEVVGSDNTTAGVQIQTVNNNAGTSAYNCYSLNNDKADATITHFGALCQNSSTYSDTTFGTGLAVPNQLSLQNTDGPLSLIASTSTSPGYVSFLTGSTAMTSERLRITNTGNIGIGTTTPPSTFSVTGNGLISSANSNAFVVGPNALTNPTLQVDASTASSASGIQIKSAAAGGGIALNAISSGTNEAVNIAGKGTGAVNLIANGTTRIAASNAGITLTGVTALTSSANNSASSRLTYNGAADTALQAGNEATSVYFSMGQTRQHASNTNIALQRDLRVTGSTHSFATAGGVITQAAAVAIDGPDSGGANTTITNSSALLIGTTSATTLASTTNGFGVQIFAPTGATNNYAASSTGRIIHNGLTTSASAQTVNICGSSSDGGELIADTVSCLVSAARFKTNIATSSIGLDELMKLRPVSFTWKNDFNKNFLNDPNRNGTQYSLIADEVQKVDPNLVVVTTATTTFEGKTYAPGTVEGLADVNHWVSVIVAWLQQIVHRQDDQQKQIDALKAQITAQQAQIDVLTSKLKK